MASHFSDKRFSPSTALSVAPAGLHVLTETYCFLDGRFRAISPAILLTRRRAATHSSAPKCLRYSLNGKAVWRDRDLPAASSDAV